MRSTRFWVLIAFAAVFCLITIGFIVNRATIAKLASSKWRKLRQPPLTRLDENRMFESSLSAESCKTCHPMQFREWETSKHARANRLADIKSDSHALNGSFVKAGDTTFHFTSGGNGFQVAVGESGTTTTFPVAGVIGFEPLWQCLLPVGNGSYQVTSVAYDPKEKEWFHVFGDEPRLPGEWGHWMQRGMNWNSNCAYCHTTSYKKNHDIENDSYHSTWFSQGINCIQCHAGAGEHAAAARKQQHKPTKTLTAAQQMDSCATCHARREELTANAFQPGDSFHDHYRVTLPDVPGVYYPDGQVRDEDFEYGSFIMSRMGHAGVTCNDCHKPHSLELKLPAENNMLCMQCHGTGKMKAPIIEPEAHSHHEFLGKGASCVECHMPTTKYMMRDPRRDHGFTSPDPLLTKELGIPNSCNRCHVDKSTDWALDWTTKWYGTDYNKVARRRARVVHAAQTNAADAMTTLLAAAHDETIPAWKSVFASQLAPFAADPAVATFLDDARKDKHPLVRSASVRALGAVNPTAAIDSIKDQSRLVRLEAALVQTDEQLRSYPIVASELREYLEMNADRAGGALRLADRSASANDPEQATLFIQRAMDLDKRNPDIMHDAAVVAARIGRIDKAQEYLARAVEVAPDRADLVYSFALTKAEAGDLRGSIAAFEQTVKLDANFGRAWYNLALAYTKIGEWNKALTAIEKAEKVLGSTGEILQTKAIIMRALGTPQQ